MPRLCCGCCFSRKKRQSFPIHEKQKEIEGKKVFNKHVETARLTPSVGQKKTKSKVTTKQASKEKTPSDSHEPPSKLFRKSKQLETPSPLPMSIGDSLEETHKKTPVVTAPSPSSSPEQRSPAVSSAQKRNDVPAKKLPNGNKSPAKSKLVLENVRKMIKDQNIHQQHLNHGQQKESVRL